ncbi:AGAP009184-PA [Anopheles gambiae str. PEST]|uniref:AGAP009184-PA n=1 Tax=Anopheles gambiae TaxID=7165 RepID=Q7PVT8_ANOGA|nr:fibrinogen C domain-containing protein 1 [Anopheles gambiae]EAA43404.4 AGAP009184-PA [Anopheles gambiae str. PEST]
MFAHKVIVLLALALCSTTIVRGTETNGTNTFTEFAFGIISNKLQTLQKQLSEMEFTMKQTNQKQTTLLARLDQINIDHERMRKEMQQLASKKDLDLFMINSGINLRSVSFPSCKKNPSKRSGKYIMQPAETDEPFLGYCEQTAYGGGWLVFQYRYDGSVDFYRNWTEYRNGFGSMDGEFWLGLEHLHRMTSAAKHELLVELKDFDGSYMYASYAEFAIGSEEDQYPLTKLGSYTGTANDSLLVHKGKTFSTKDREGSSNSSCAVLYKGAWWYAKCYDSNLNGVYRNSENAENIVWGKYKLKVGLAFSRMMIREV